MTGHKRNNRCKVKRGGNPRRVGDIARHVFSDVGKADVQRRFDTLLRLRSIWEQIVGVQMANHVSIANVRADGTLVVHGATSAWMNEVHCLKHQILERIREIDQDLGITELIIKPGSYSREDLEKRPCKSRRRPSNKGVGQGNQESIAKLLREINDPQLKNVLNRLFKRTIEYARRTEGNHEPKR